MTGEDIAWKTDKVKSFFKLSFHSFKESKIRPKQKNWQRNIFGWHGETA